MSRRASTRVSTRLGTVDRPIRTSRPPGSTSCGGLGRYLRRVGRVDHRVEAEAGQAGGGPAVVEAQGAGEVERVRLGADQVDLVALGPRDQRGQQADGARADDQQPVTGGQAGAVDRAHRVAAWFDQRAGHRVDAVGQRDQRVGRDQQKLGQRARPAVPDADFVAVGAEVVATALTALALAAAEHRVAGYPAAEPGSIDAVADAGDDAAPFVADPDRVAGLAGLQVRHVTGDRSPGRCRRSRRVRPGRRPGPGRPTARGRRGPRPRRGR